MRFITEDRGARTNCYICYYC